MRPNSDELAGKVAIVTGGHRMSTLRIEARTLGAGHEARITRWNQILDVKNGWPLPCTGAPYPGVIEGPSKGAVRMAGDFTTGPGFRPNLDSAILGANL